MVEVYKIVILILVAQVNIYSTCASEIPVGHLKPFGFHRPPSVILDEYTVDNAPDPKTFFENHVKPTKAAIFRGAIKDSDAYKLWTDEYLRENFGDMEVRMEAKWETTFLPPVGEHYIGRDNIRHFINHYHDNDPPTYVVSDLPEKMYRDVGVFPSIGACGEMVRNFIEMDIWWSGGDTRSIIHKDAYNQINCLVNGTKYWKLIEYKYEKDLYKHEEAEDGLGGFSDVKPRKVDLLKYPLVKNIEWSNFTIHAGDCLYLPKSYYHQIDSYGTNNLAVSILFGRFDGRESLDFSDCTSDTDYKKLRRLSEFDVHWPWKGYGVLPMGRGELEDDYRVSLFELVNETEEQGLPFDVKALGEITMDDKKTWQKELYDFEKAFNRIDKNKDGLITKDEVSKMTFDDLRAYGEYTAEFEPSSSYEFEYSIIVHEKVLRAIRFSLKHNEILKRETWIKVYRTLGGTSPFANEVFTRLAGSESASSVRCSEVSKSDLVYALENWRYYWAPQYSVAVVPPTDEYDEIECGEIVTKREIPDKHKDQEGKQEL